MSDVIDRRPDPDELLQRVREEEQKASRGKLTIFFGAAPGVGKTYTMLEAARIELTDQTRDVVVGIVETHGRYDTGALLIGLELLPRRKTEHRGIVIEEFDLEAALARRPDIILIDELAHTNAPGSRHVKRWQDVEDLLQAGINVFTTLNVQHLESLNDVVAQITGVVVRETVPDSVFDKANEVRVVDLPVDQLLDRLREGKVYLPHQAQRAIQNFFKEGNLIALRELALRRTAERVDAQMRGYKAAHGIDKTWHAGERVLVCISPSPYSARLLRAARRMATSIHAELLALYVETPAALRLRAADRERVAAHMRLAEQLGGEAVTIRGDSAAEETVRFARKRNVTKIVVGKPTHPRWRDILKQPFLDQVVRRSGEIDVYVISGLETAIAKQAAPEGAKAPRRPALSGYLAALAAVTVATLVGLAFGRSQLTDVVMIFLLGIVVASMRFGYGPALVAAVASVVSFDFFFVPPYYSFVVTDLRHIVTFVVMFLVAGILSHLTKRIRDQADSARDRERRTASLYAISRELAVAQTFDALLTAGARHVRDVFDGAVAVLLPTDGDALSVAYADPGAFDGTSAAPAAAWSKPDGTSAAPAAAWSKPDPTSAAPAAAGSQLHGTSAMDGAGSKIEAKELGLAEWVWTHQRLAGAGTDTLPSGRVLFVPLKGARGRVGVLALVPKGDPNRLQDPEERQLLETFAGIIGSAVERAQLAEEARRARVRAETEQLRNSLLSSVSHDLRTPLAVVTGAASTLLDKSAPKDPGEQRELLETIHEEGLRLNRLVRNLLDMTRLDAGALRVNKELQPIEEVIGAALNRNEDRLKGRTVNTHVPTDLPLVPLDAVLIEQVLINLLENATKYTPPGTPIDVVAYARDKAIEVEVADRGPGVPREQAERVFEKFYRAREEGGGVGLGLTICRGIINAHGGRIWVAPRPEGGASFRFTLPLDDPGATQPAPGHPDVSSAERAP
jgi:two-component system, OmpR family, sensor histidine kinase KdpD